MVSRKSNIGKTIVLLILLIIIVMGGFLWFDFLGIINAKSFFAPVYRLAGLEPQTSISNTKGTARLEANLDSDRLAKRLEALEIRSEELDKREFDLVSQEEKSKQIAEDLLDKQKLQEEREKTFNNEVKKYDDRDVNIVKNADALKGMPPAKAVEIMLEMDDQDVIDILRKVDEIAEQSGESSMVAYWMSLMPAENAAEIQRKMLNK
ncbi:MAG TPA: flagellar protein FlbB [Treponemataceae bacterium]|nr:flagellar protein FlbB [Treponemataceae bacterium]